MKILHIINSLHHGGAELFIIRLASAQVKLGNIVNILVLQSASQELIELCLNGGIKLHVLNSRRLSIMPFFVIAKYRSKIDVIHSHLGPSQYYVAFSKSLFLTKCKLVTTEHSTTNNRWHSKVLILFDKFVYSQYDNIVAISESVSFALNGIVNCKGKIQVIRNGIELNLILKSKKIDFYEAHKIKLPVILCVGRFSIEKGQDILLKAFSRSEGMHLMLIGGGPMECQLITLISELGISDRVTILGPRLNVYDYMKSCYLYVQPSRVEGFGLACLEALVAGANCIISSASGLVEVLGDYCETFDSGNDDALHHAISKFHLNNGKLKKSISFDSKQYSMARVATEYQVIYAK